MKSIPSKSYPSNTMGWLSIPLAVVVALAMYPLPSLDHSKGIYSSKADAEQRASEIGCTTVHENKGKWMPCSDEQELHRQLRKQ